MTQSSSNNGITAFEALRSRLESLAYRLLRSRAEAEDVVQDAWLKWHAADANALREPAAWLATITTRLAIDRLRRLRRERMPRAHGALPQTWPGDAGEAGDSGNSGHSGHSGHAADWAPSAEDLALRAAEMSHGLLLLLERLSPVERAAFVLHEGFDCDYAEIARIVGKTPANCRQIVHRARERLQRPGMPSAPDDPARHRQVVDRLREAIALQDRAGVMALVEATTAVGYEACDPAPLMERDEVSALAHASQRFGNALTWTQTRHRLLHAEPGVAIEGEPRVALLDAEGEIVALIAVSVAVEGSENAPIARMAIITDAAVLRAANRLYGARAVKRLLQRIFEQPARSGAVRCSAEEAIVA